MKSTSGCIQAAYNADSLAYLDVLYNENSHNSNTIY